MAEFPRFDMEHQRVSRFDGAFGGLVVSLSATRRLQHEFLFDTHLRSFGPFHGPFVGFL